MIKKKEQQNRKGSPKTDLHRGHLTYDNLKEGVKKKRKGFGHIVLNVSVIQMGKAVC